jgi:3-oxoacyl-[acyl-carrier protein] reductase
LTQLALPLLRKGRAARVINLGDSGADRIQARTQAVPYHVAKLGVHVLTRSFAKALGPDGITVNQISPGVLENSVDGPEHPIPLGRRGRFEDILGALDYLLSPEAGYVSGANIVVSGGWNV